MALDEQLKDALMHGPDDAVAIDPWQVIRSARRRRRGRVLLSTSLALMAVAGLTAVAVSAVPEDAPTTATTAAGSSAAGPAASGDNRAAVVVAYEAQVSDWAACLRSNGITVDSPTGYPYDTLIRQLGDHKRDPDFRAATERCAALQPEVTPELEKAWGQDPMALLSVDQVQIMQEYAACMRLNGASDFPTPGPNGFTEDQWTAWSRAAEQPSAKVALSVCGPLSLPASR